MTMDSYSKRHKRLLELLVYISSNLENKLSLEELSQVSKISKFHLGRIFEAHMGLTLGQYVRLKKLEHGMLQVVLTKKGILDIALDSGYESHAAFCKEFKKQFGMSPRDFKKRLLEGGMKTMDIHSIKPEFIGIENCDPIQIAYVRKTGNYFKSAPEAWDSLARKLQKFQLVLAQYERFGISHDNPHAEGIDEESMRFDASIRRDAIAPEIIEKLNLETAMIEGGPYAKFLHRGPVERLGESFHYIYGHWLYTEDYHLRPLPPFSRYTGPKPSTIKPEEQIAEIHIPVKSEKTDIRQQ